MSIKIYGSAPVRNYAIVKPNEVSGNKYKKIRDLSWDIKKIKNETEYIKQTGNRPATTPDYYKRKLNIIS